MLPLSPEHLQTDWLEARNSHRAFLFGDQANIDHESVDNASVASLADKPLTIVARRMLGPGRMGNRTYTDTAARLGASAAAIVRHHDTLARDEGPGLFVIPDKLTLDYIAEATAETVMRWDYACKTARRAEPFPDMPDGNSLHAHDYEQLAVQRVVETAAGIIDILHAGITVTRDPQAASFKLLVNTATRRGPAFIQAWMDGSILHGHCKQEGLDPDFYLGAISKSKLGVLALNNGGRDPAAAAVRYVDRLYENYSVPNIIKATGWPEDQVRLVFSNPIRRRLAGSNVNKSAAAVVRRVAKNYERLQQTPVQPEAQAPDATTPKSALFPMQPLEAAHIAVHVDPAHKLATIAANLEMLFDTAERAKDIGWPLSKFNAVFIPAILRRTAFKLTPAGARAYIALVADTYTNILSDANIGAKLGWTPQQVTELFTPGLKAQIATGSPKIAMQQVRKIAKTRSELTATHPAIPVEVINSISRERPGKSGLDIAARIEQALLKKPAKYSTNLWAWAAFKKPGASDEVRMATADKWLALIGGGLLRSSTALSLDAPHPITNQTLANKRMASTEDPDIFPGEPDDYLQSIAAKAGIAYEDVARLLEAFSNDADVLPPKLIATLNALRASVRTAHGNS